MGVKDRQVMAIARNLSELFQELTVLNGLPEGDLVLSGIKIDSREITSGDLYLAIRGHGLTGTILSGMPSVGGLLLWWERDRRRSSPDWLYLIFR
jgi:UDP-N-acetylmuramyl pentapeptide synthase